MQLVSLEDFFEGNRDPESMAVDLLSADPRSNDHPGLSYFHQALTDIRSRPDVQDVLVEVFEVELALAEKSAWPFAGSGGATLERAAEDRRRHRGVSGGHEGERSGAKPGYKVWHVVWD